MKYVLPLFLLFVPLLSGAAHIGDVSIERIRNFHSQYVVVSLNKEISNPPSCATVKNKLVFTGMDTDWGKQKLSMLMTAFVAGYKVDPNCQSTCKTNWDGEITVCSEVSIEK